jgi:rhodanese-related sulfurtransferase
MNTLSAPQHLPHELEAALAAPAPPVLLDVREYPEFAAGHLKDARLIPLAEIERRAGELPRDQPIVAMCRSGGRSAEAAEKLARLGFTNVSQLAGGVMAWKQAGLPLAKEAHVPWALERQVRFVAGLLILLGLGLSYIWSAAIVLVWLVPLGLVCAAITDSCLMGMLLAKLPWNRRAPLACSTLNS